MISIIQDPTADTTDRRFEQILCQLEAARQRVGRARVIAIAGCRGGDGTTFVLGELARRLAERSHRGVLTADCADLVLASRLKPGELLAQCSFSRDAGLWLLSSPDRDSGLCFSERPGDADVVSAMAALSARFDFVFMSAEGSGRWPMWWTMYFWWSPPGKRNGIRWHMHNESSRNPGRI
jgi:putative protein kinase ArgK-like GTPase of G3E family